MADNTDDPGRAMTGEETSRAYLEMIAMARGWLIQDCDASVKAQNDVLAGMELPSHFYIAAAGRLMVDIADMLAVATDGRIGHRDILDLLMRNVLKKASPDDEAPGGVPLPPPPSPPRPA